MIEKVPAYFNCLILFHEKVFITDISVNEKVAEMIDSIHQEDPTIFYIIDHHKVVNWLNQYDCTYVKPKNRLNTTGVFTDIPNNYYLSINE